MALILLSHLVNILVAGFLPFVLLGRSPSPGMDAAYGPDLPARRILACLYGAIAVMSAYALVAWGWLDQPGAPAAIGAVLFPLQVIYKAATLPALGPGHPVAQANGLIALLHLASAVLILSAA